MQLGHLYLNALLIFDTVVEAGSFTAAAERLGVAKAKVSVQVARLEQQLGTSLFTRTTRRVALTDAGRVLHAECKPLLQGLQDALHAVGNNDAALSGTLRISTSVDHAMQSLAPAAAEFATLHPALNIDLRSSDRIADLVAEGIDLAIRLGWLRDSSLRAVQLGEFDQYVVASPAYLRRAGKPKRPEQLAELEWLALTLLQSPLTWRFTAKSGETSTVQVKARIRTDSPGALRAMLRRGAGISVLDQYSAEEDIEAGTLVRVLADWQLPRGGVHAVYPSGRHVPPKVRAFIDFYRAWLQQR